MNVVAINGCAGKEGNTAALVQAVCDELEKQGAPSESACRNGRREARVIHLKA